VRARGKPLREYAGGEKRFVIEKLRYGLSKVQQGFFFPGFIHNIKVALFEALAPAFDRRKADGLFVQNGINLGVYRFISLPLQEQEFHHDSLLKPVHLELTNVQVDFFMTSGH
jgi:hypothetical protein